MKSFFLVLTFLSLSFCLCAQNGSLMLVGGGAESDAANAWSNTPYRWAIEQSANKRVAIISDASSSDPAWLPNYFESLGATAAQNFVVSSRGAANEASLYETLMGFDVFFFKGGDQFEYYELWQNQMPVKANKISA